MAIIGKIREKSGLVVTIVGIGLFLFIVPLDKIIQQFSGSTAKSDFVFNGNDQNAIDWNLSSRIANYKNQINTNNRAFQDIENDYINSVVFNNMIADTILSLETNKIGIKVSNGELNDGILNESHHLPTKEKENYIKGDTIDDFINWKNQISNQDVRTQMFIENDLKTNRSRDKYRSMLKYGVLGTYEEGKRSFIEEQTNVEISYIFKPYQEIPDSVVDLNDENRESYFTNHRYEAKWEYLLKNDIVKYDYVVLNIKPSDRDKEEAKKVLDDVKTIFEDANNDNKFINDSAFAQSYGIYFEPNYKGGKFSNLIDQKIENSSKGDVIGPFINIDKVQLIKVLDSVQEEQAKVRHILINSREGDLNDFKNKKLADSILYAIKLDSSKFNSLVTKYSDDQGSVANGGVYAWFPKGQMVPEFEDFSFNNSAGKVGVVKTTYGYHIIQVLGKRMGAFNKLAIKDRYIKVSETTRNEFYDSVARNFYDLAKETSFNEAAEEFGLIVKESGNVRLEYPQVTINNNGQPQYTSLGLFGPYELNKDIDIAKWAFNNEVGHIMEPEDISENQIAIAVLKEKIIENDIRFNNLKSIMEPEVKNKLKAEYFINNNKIDSKTSMDTIAKSLNLKSNFSNVKYSDRNIGNNYQQLPEPKLIAKIFHMNENETSSIIEGESGLYIVKVLMRNNAKINETTDFSSKVDEYQNYLRNLIEQTYYGSLYKAYNVKDQRAKSEVSN
mgnify:CR=1 FL=1